MGPEDIDRLHGDIERLRKEQITAASQADYAHDWRQFTKFCQRIGREPFPTSPDTLALFVADILHRGRKLSTACRYAAGVAFYHTSRGLESPLTGAVRSVLIGARQVRCEQLHQMTPITLEKLKAITRAMRGDRTACGVRDLSILTLGFASALRRSNLSWLTLEDLEFIGEAGVRIHVQREKQDRRRQGRFVGVPFGKERWTCPVRSLNAWLRIRGTAPGPVYVRLDNARSGPLDPLTPNAFMEIVKKAAARIDPSGIYGAHSLRAGMITSAGEKGVGHLLIAKQSGHKSLDSLGRYFRPTDLFRANAASLLGL